MSPILWVAALCLGSADPPRSDPETLFATRVLPSLNGRCVACHGDDPAKRKGGLDLTSREGALLGGDSGEPAILPGKGLESPLLRAVGRDDPDVSPMPPKENDRLSDAEVLAIRDWIDAGAPWPSPRRVAELAKAAAPTGVRVPTSGGLSPDWTDRFYKPEDLWAYQPLRRPEVPRVDQAASPIDAFLQKADAAQTPLADRRTLARRVTFDLTGLPPTPEEIDRFVDDPTPDDQAFARVVDRLLASPHRGEQLAR
ncbi:MAG: DUF1549 domain-containing protein, partial [Isosphaeraceae bacterium]